MKVGRFLGLFLLLGTEFEWVCGEETLTSFMKDAMATFRLKSPTIVYDSDEIPEICYKETWVLCLSSRDQQNDQKYVQDYSKGNEPTNQGREGLSQNILHEERNSLDKC